LFIVTAQSRFHPQASFLLRHGLIS
jgi:hypothetical protein